MLVAKRLFTRVCVRQAKTGNNSHRIIIKDCPESLIKEPISYSADYYFENGGIGRCGCCIHYCLSKGRKTIESGILVLDFGFTPHNLMKPRR